MAAGDRPSLVEVAEESWQRRSSYRLVGPVHATVSKVLNRKDQFISEETREKIWSLVKELNYTPNSMAGSLITRSSRVIGIIGADILNAYFTELDEAARERGHSTILCNSDSDP